MTALHFNNHVRRRDGRFLITNNWLTFSQPFGTLTIWLLWIRHKTLEVESRLKLRYRIIKITHRIDTRCRLFKISVPRGATNSRHRTGYLYVLFYADYITPLDFCVKVIVSKKHRNLEKTTSSVLYVILIYDLQFL